MSDATEPSQVNPWLALWFRPRSTIEAVLSRNLGLTSLAIAVVGSVLAVSAGMNEYFHVLDDGLDPSALRIIAPLALAVAIIAVIGYYLTGWVLNAVARLIGGRGSAAGTRAAWAWSSVPLLVSSLVTLAASGHAELTWLSVSTAVIAGILSLWWVVLATAMLARVQNFGVLRALFSILVGAIGLALAIALGVRTFALQPFNTPSGSMLPTLQVGDYFFASKWAYGYSRYSFPFAPAWFEGRLFAREPRRGDVVVFRNPKDDTDYVKRIVGLPGEKIQLKRARLYIDDKLVERRAVEPGFPVPALPGKTVVAATYDEYLPGGGVHRIIQLQGDDGALSNTEAFVTPPGAYFVLGDNRDNSVDSRMAPAGRIGFVPFETLIGRADIIYYSAAEDPETRRWTQRSERIGERLK